MAAIPTVKIQTSLGYAIINQEDFDPHVHVLYQDQQQPDPGLPDDSVPVEEDVVPAEIVPEEDSRPGEFTPKKRGGWPKGKPRKS